MQNKTIHIFEYGWLKVGDTFDDGKIEFKQSHFLALCRYLTNNPKAGYFTLYLNRIRFCNYVGVIMVDDLIIEVLPKTDRHDASPKLWQRVLLDMLSISLQVQAKTTTHADIHVRQHSVLEAYLQLFLEETEILLHQGLVKKYRTNISNQNALKGKLLVHQQVTKNLVHRERFYVSHQVYDRNNVYNAILKQTLNCIGSIHASDSIDKSADKLLLDFPECEPIKASTKLFERLIYDRKTERYKTAVELAKIILLNYHPDLKGGANNILAIMFDMNVLWETYVYKMIKKASSGDDKNTPCNVLPQQQRRRFWQHPDRWTLHLKPDIVVEKTGTTYILDTKWKYQKDTSMEDVRQMYAYGNYWEAKKRYLMYPDNIEKEVKKEDGLFYDTRTKELSKDDKCGLMFVNLLNEENSLNKKIGTRILEELFKS